MRKMLQQGKKLAAVCILLIFMVFTAGAVDIIVDNHTRYQTIDGFGASVMNWLDSVYANTQNRSDYVQDLGCSIIRGELHPAAITKDDCMDANPVTFGTDIDQNVAMMDFGGHYRLSITGNFMKAVYNQRLDEMKVMLSIWTPPHWMKTNAVLSAEYGCQSYQGHLTRTTANRTQFARYVAAWIKGFSNYYSIPVYSLSVQNELDWAHDPSTYTTSCQYFSTRYPSDRSNGPPLGENDINPAISFVYNELQAHNMGYIKLMGPEKSHILAGSYEMDVQLSFINDMAAAGTALNQLGIFCYHGYGTAPGKRTTNAAYWDEIKGYGKPSWQTEAGGQALNWSGAMELATVIQDELVAGNVSAYLYWSYAGSGSDLLALKINSTQKTDKYTAFKHFSRYIRPGAVRVSASPDDPAGLSVSAYRHDTQGTLTIVMVNNASTQTANISLPALGITSFDAYTSREGALWSHATANVSGSLVSVTVPGNGIVTLYGRSTAATPTPTRTPTFTPTPTPTLIPTPTPTPTPTRTLEPGLTAAPRVAARASSEAGSGWTAAGVIDNITAPDNGWSSVIAADGTAEWIYIDMGATHSLAKVVLVPRTQGTTASILAFPNDFRFEYSSDASVWTTVPGQSYTGYPAPAANSGEEFLFGTAVACRYLRVAATGFRTDDYNNKHLQLAEIYLYSLADTGSAPGDVNNDGKVDINDALLVARYAALLNPAGFDPGRADVDNSGSITIVDALLIARKVAGIITDF